MNISSVRLENFRGFRDAGIKLKPLTVLLGPNSAGKSSFSHALASLAHCQWLYQSTGKASLTPRGDAKAAEDWPIDLGRYSDLCTSGHDERVFIELMTPSGAFRLGFGKLKESNDLDLSYMRLPLAPEETLAGHGAVTTVNETASLPTSGSGAVKDIKIRAPGLEIQRADEVNWRAGNELMRPDLNGLLLDKVRFATGTDVQVDSTVRHYVGEFLNGLTYLRASRKRPARGYDRTPNGRNPLGYAGEWSAAALERDPVTVEFMRLPPVPASLEEARRVIDALPEKQTGKTSEAVGAWLRWLELAYSIESRPSPTYPDKLQICVELFPGKPRDITEVGYGVSQVIPVILSGLMQSSDSLLIVDLPEAHLHPRPQARLADFFCSMVHSGKSALVETHSEMFFHRLRLRAAMSEELRENIVIYFFDPPDENGLCPLPREIGLDGDDELKWPDGFLQEAWETEAAISVVREARNQRR